MPALTACLIGQEANTVGYYAVYEGVHRDEDV